ncbi:hypothetical protein [Paraglaciecola sp. 2405UD69-4]|uniref:hypothetical protein n=1 Tax=Paraglaciecola sp. 2405UD69-4 TaxID=3391836 RepID=UPI0039C9AC4C
MMRVEPVKEVPDFGENVEVTELLWDFDKTKVCIYCPKSGKEYEVFFNNEFGPSSIRLLDESDLSENWVSFNLRSGWLYRVASGGWFDQEAERDGFLMKHSGNLVKEYLIVGLDACVSVITKENVIVLSKEGGQSLEIRT